MSLIVTTMKTAKTHNTPVTMSDCARATNAAPTRLTPTIAITSAEVKTLSHHDAASVPTKSEVA